MLGELLSDMKKAASGDSRVPGALLKMIKVDIVSFLQEAPQRHKKKKKGLLLHSHKYADSP